MKFNRNLIDICYDVIKKDPKLRTSEFEFGSIVKSLKLSEEDLAEIRNQIGALYIELLQDARFIYVNGNKWALKENYTFSEYNQKINELYDFDTTVQEDDAEEQPKSKPSVDTIKNEEIVIDDEIEHEEEQETDSPDFFKEDESDDDYNQFNETLDVEISDNTDMDIEDEDN